MFIHIGNRKTVSGRHCVGIFNADTLRYSDENDHIISRLGDEDETIIIMDNGKIETSSVSSVTIIKRVAEDLDEYIWRRKNDKDL